MSRSDYKTVSSLVRSLLDEGDEPVTWTEGTLFPIAAEAQRYVVARLGATGAKFLEDDLEMEVLAGRAEILAADLPDEFLFPLALFERPLGSNVDYGEPMERRRSRFSTYQQDQTLNEWMWKARKIKFIGATTDRQVRIEYRTQLPLVVDWSTELAIPGSENAIAWRCVMNAEYSRGNRSLQDRAKIECEAAIALLKTQNAQSMQSAPVRRRPYGYYGSRP